MLLSHHVPSPARSRHDAVFAALLTVTLLVATSPFFWSFSLGALAVGLLTGVSLHRWYASRVPAPAPAATGSAAGPSFNIAALQVGGDAGGLIFVLGSIVIFTLSVPGFRWFLLGSIAAACAVAAALSRRDRGGRRGAPREASLLALR
jgi:hypothetical protein